MSGEPHPSSYPWFTRALLLGIFFSALGPSAADARERNNEASLRSLLTDTVEAWDIRAEGSPAFRMEASITIPAMPKDAPPATWRLAWFDAENWREDLSLPGYQLSGASGPSGRWHYKSSQDLLPVVSHIRRLVRAGQTVRIRADDRLRSKPSTEGEPILRILRTSGRSKAVDEFHVNTETNALTAVVTGHDGLRYEYEGLVYVGQRTFPKSMRVSFEGKAIANVMVRKVSPGRKPEPGLLDPPPGATLMADSPGLENPARTAHVRPRFPTVLQKRGIAGVVIVRALIDVEGAVDNVEVVRSPHPQLTEEAVSAVEQWRYTPGRLRGKAVPVQMTIRVMFSLSTGQQRTSQWRTEPLRKKGADKRTPPEGDFDWFD